MTRQWLKTSSRTHTGTRMPARARSNLISSLSLRISSRQRLRSLSVRIGDGRQRYELPAAAKGSETVSRLPVECDSCDIFRDLRVETDEYCIRDPGPPRSVLTGRQGD